MIALIQRVEHANVVVDGKTIGAIDKGVLALIGVEKEDTDAKAQRLLERLLNYRIFADSEDKMNLSLRDTQGGLLLVPQFTLAADTQKGNRPSFSSAATPEQGETLFNFIVTQARKAHNNVETGQFGADMKVSLLNDGPVTFWLQV
ncbi:MAG: D-aminoacyl-tRNA deacylase [Gammaproteobacteria bacterium]|jgi:D-tyrosyl-tRNA(Tyr) deacylase